MDILGLKFIMLIGLPGSGKSFYAEKLAKELNASIVSTDAIRLSLYGDENIQGNAVEVFDRAIAACKLNLLKNKSTIFDATNLVSKRRKHFLEQLNLKRIECEKIAIFVATPYEICLQQNSRRSRVVPEYVIFNMYKSFQVPTKSEGFDRIEVMYPQNSNKDISIDSLLDRCSSFNQDNPHHSYTLGNHLLAATDYLKTNFIKESDQPDLYFATLLHDIGKLYTKTFLNMRGEESDVAHYYNHNNIGAYMTFFIDIPDDIKFNVALLIQYHMQFYIAYNKSEKAKQKDFKILGDDLFKKLEILHECDLNAH